MNSARWCLLGTVAACGGSARQRPVSVTPGIAVEDPAGTGTLELGRWHERRGTSPDAGPTASANLAWRTAAPGSVLDAVGTDGDTLWVSVEGRVLSLTRDGSVAWDEDVRAVGAVTATDEGPAVATADGVVLVLEPQDGKTRKAYPAGGTLAGPPTTLGGELAWVNQNGTVVGASGWVVEAATSAAGGAVSTGDMLFFTTREGELVATNPSGVQWRSPMPGGGIGHPVTNGTIVLSAYGVRTGGSGGVIAFSAEDGAEVWRWATGFEPAAPPAWGSAVFVADMGGVLRALDPLTGEEIWHTEGETAFSATPTVTPLSVYAVEVTGRVSRLDPDDGGQVWVIDLASAATASPAVMGDLLVVGLANGSVVAIGPDRGSYE